MGMEWCNSYHYVSAILIEPFQAGIKICTRIRTEESAGVNEAFSLRWFSLCLLLTALHSVYCAVILALIETSMNFFAPETLLFSCSNLFSVIDIHSTGSWSKWLLVLGNLRASTLQVRSLNDHLLSSQKTCVFRGLLCVSENFVFRDGNLSSVMNWLNSCRLRNYTARTGRFLLKWTNQVILICLISNDTHTLCNHASKDLLCHDNYFVVIILNYFIWQERFIQNQHCQNLWWRFLWKNPWWWTDWLRQVICAA